MHDVIFYARFPDYKNEKCMMLQPIVSLLYDQCDPLACASAIFALAHKSHRKKNFPLIQQMAQCMIYLDDPHLAIDIMASGNMQNKMACSMHIIL